MIKPAEMWLHELDANKTGFAICTIAQIRQIQRDALIEGLTMFAWWKDGTQYVGTCGTTLREAIAEMDRKL